MANTTAKYFEAGNGPYSGAYVGTGNGSGANALSTCYFQFKTGDSGATKISFQTSNATADVRGSPHSDDGIAAMRFAISASSTQYKTTKSSTAGYAAEGSYGNYIKGTLSIKLLPNTTYYLWVFPNSSFPGTTRFALGSCTVTLTGTYGTASSISASNGTFGSGIPITLANSVSGVTNTVSLAFTARSGSTDYAYTVTTSGIKRNGSAIQGSSGLVKKTDGTYTWTPDLLVYGPLIPSAKSVTVTISCVTTYGSATWGTSTKTITVSFPSSVGPSISAVGITYDNDNTAASAFTMFVQGYSKAKATITAAGQYGASISTYALTINGATVSGDSNTQTSAAVTTSGTVTATIKVTDSRGFTATVTRDFTVQPYSNPTLTGFDLHRSNSSGTAAENGTCLYAYAVGNISSLIDPDDEQATEQNTLTMSVAYKTTTGSYGQETSMTSGTAAIVSGLSADMTYVARITLTDGLGNSAIFVNTIRNQKWAMKFNADATAVGFGKAPEADKVLEIPYDWEIARKTSDGTATHYALFDDDDIPVDRIDGALPVNKGGTGATAASAARSNLGLGYLATKTSYSSWIAFSNVTVSGSVGANTYNTFSVDVTKSGWYPLGIVGINCSGSGSTSIPILRYYLTNRETGSCTANVLVRNVSSSAASPTFTISILWADAS